MAEENNGSGPREPAGGVGNATQAPMPLGALKAVIVAACLCMGCAKRPAARRKAAPPPPPPTPVPRVDKPPEAPPRPARERRPVAPRVPAATELPARPSVEEKDPFVSRAYGSWGRAGLRSAERASPTRIIVVYGPGFGTWQFEKNFHVYQVVSPTDQDFQRGVSAERVRIVKTEPDADYPPRWGGPRCKRYTLEVSLPGDRPMKGGHRYWIRVNAHGVGGLMQRARWIVEPGATPPEGLQPRYGIREIYILSPRALHLVTGSGLDTDRLGEEGTVVVTCPEDPDFEHGVSPSALSRRSNLDFYIPAGWPWQFRQRHEIFLMFDKRFKAGRTYTVDINAKAGSPLTVGVARATIDFDDRKTINLAIKVNQCGYLPEAKEKYGYLGMWTGELNACDFAPYAKSFEVRDAETHRTVMRGTPRLRRKATYRIENGKAVPDPKKVKGPETVYKMDLSYEDVYQIDISALRDEGAYYVAVPGMGRSFAFRVARDVYVEPFRITMNGIFHQRCGIEFKEPRTKHYRPACHRNKTEYSTFRIGIDKDPWKNLPKFATDGAKHDIWGGHHDAGDWNPRAHLEVAEVLFLLYEMNSGAFRDGQLDIPEKGNGFPDILDEAHWALDLWTRLQDADGGVHHGIESNGDPRQGDTPATDTLREFAFAKDAAGSYWFAAVAAQASVIWKELGRKEKAADFLRRAVRAWDWAGKTGGDEEHDRHVFAAAMLFRATGKERYDEAFGKHSVYTRNPGAEPRVWQKHDQVYGSYYYATLPKADPTLKAAIVASFEKFFKAWRRAAETTTYRYMRSPYAPNNWGTGGLPKWLAVPAMTMQLTGDSGVRESCRQWIVFTDDFSLGCHPMNLVFTVGLGQRYVTGAWHILMANSPEGIIPGIQTEAAGGRWVPGEAVGRGGMGKWPSMSLFPHGPWPDLYKYSEGASPGMNEGVVATQVKTAFAYGLLMPELK